MREGRMGMKRQLKVLSLLRLAFHTWLFLGRVSFIPGHTRKTAGAGWVFPRERNRFEVHAALQV